MKGKDLIFLAFHLLLAVFSFAQTSSPFVWRNPAINDFPVIEGQAWSAEVAAPYDRFPARAEKTLNPNVWNISHSSAGLYIKFKTNASGIVIRYTVKGALDMTHMPATGVSGVDLYSIDPNGQWKWAPAVHSFGDTIEYRFSNIMVSSEFPGRDYEYRLYLPLYNTVTWLTIGVPGNSSFHFMPLSAEKPIVVYGTSIAQGACASRPGLAWTNLLSRISGYEVINLGFSGNGRLEPEVIDYLDQLDPDFFILDCLPNVADRSPDEVRQKIINAVEQMRRAHPATPIILAEHAGFGNESTNELNRTRCSNVNAALGKALADLHTRRVKGLYVLEKKAIGLDGDCFVDQVHPNDAGMMRYARAYERVIRRIARHRSPIAGASRSSAPGISPP